MNGQVLLVRRYLECAAFVLLWMACEHYFHLSPITSQLLGLPLIAAFQLAVARRPLAQLWVRDAQTFRIDAGTIGIAAALAIGCGALLWLGRGHAAAGLGRRLPFFLLVLAAVIPAAFALRQQRSEAFRRALPLFLAAVVWRIVWQAGWHEGRVGIPAEKWLDFLTLWACEFVALFLVDEVAFRGALDPHLAGAATGRLHAWCSAIFVSILWAIWHLPAYNPGAKSFFALFANLTPFYVSVAVGGTLLSFCARKAGTLVPTSLMHAFGNAHVLTVLK